MPTGYARTNRPGLRIRSIARSSPLHRPGLRENDVVLSVNNTRIADELDFTFAAAASELRIEFIRRGTRREIMAERKPGSFLRIDFFQKPVTRCANRCVFCFIDQMPPGLRSPLYIKDEDLSHSFLNGNYVTLSNARDAALAKIADLGLSPLFVSVHATDQKVRLALLGIRQAPPIMDQLRFLAKTGISFHTQIVVCPGYNDGTVLRRTIRDLFSLREHLLSIAVVPVGLTRFRTVPLTPVSTNIARAICRQLSVESDRDALKSGRRRLFLADEFFLKAGHPLPGARYYEDYPQIENGVGLIRLMMEEWRKAKATPQKERRLKTNEHGRSHHFLLLTAQSAAPALQAIVGECMDLRPSTTFDVIVVENRFFGTTVTVAGLLTGRDILRTIREARKKNLYHGVIVPSVIFNYAGYTLDGYSLKRLAKEAGKKLISMASVNELLFLKHRM